MRQHNVRTSRWPVPQRARIRVRLGRYVLVGRVGRVTTRATSPPQQGSWGIWMVRGQLGYGYRNAQGRVESWRPLKPQE